LNPLLHPRLVREHLAKLSLPDDLARRREVMRGWTTALRRGALADANEVQLHGEFLTRVFGDVLGYRMRTTAGEGGAYELRAEQGLSGRSADGALGFFQQNQQHIVAPIELKGANQALDTRMGRSQTPVQQAWEYASRAPESRWILVSNYDETRLYSKARGWDAYELFKLDDLDSEAGFLRFYGLLARETLLGVEPGARSLLDALFEASSVVQQEVTKRLYETYRAVRRELFEDLCRRHSNRPPLDLLPHAQTILDRVIFCAFAEDRGLIPQGTLARGIESTNPYDPDWSRWKALTGVFRGVDKGSAVLGLPPLNGGLFRQDPELDELEVSDALCLRFKDIASYDFAEDVSVEVLGHIFEQSVSELEDLRAGAEQKDLVDTQKRPSKRRAEGVFYTPSFVTRYLVDLSLGEAFREREAEAFGAAYDRTVRRSKARDLEAWERYREALKRLRVLDPACGSGAFLIAAFEALEREYDRVNRALARLRGGQIEVFDLTASVLNQNLFGVDLNGESVEITKLSLWLKTARKDQRLTYLDGNVRRGNSVVADPMLDPWAFDWTVGRTARALFDDAPSDPSLAAAIDARWREGFDVVLGNPPYVRQELLTRYKDHWKAHYASYDGVADLFVYFFERGLDVLKPGGRLAFIVSNKWLRAGYAERLRGHLARHTVVERLVDFGHAPIFPDADAFPVIVSVRKLNEKEELPADHAAQVTQFPREELHKVEVPVYVAEHTDPLPQSKLSSAAWSLATGAEDALFEKIRANGIPLKEYAGCKPLYGIKTGLNEAFIVDTATQGRLVREDPRSAEVLKKFLRGQDVARWSPEWGGLWMIVLKSSENHAWPWSGLDEKRAEASFAETFPLLYQHMKALEPALRKRSDQGRYWWELRSCAYYKDFEPPKIVFPDILWRSTFGLNQNESYLNNTTYVLPTSDAWLLAVLNSPLIWSYLWTHAQHAKDEALRMFSEFVEQIPIAESSRAVRPRVEELVMGQVEATKALQSQRAGVLDVLRMQHGIDKPGNALSAMVGLSSDAFVAEVLKRRAGTTKGPGKGAPKLLSVTAQRELRQLHQAEVAPMQERRAAMREGERALSKLVNQAYGLTPAEERLLWETAPPRMPDAR
jgi:hypothetical protein